MKSKKKTSIQYYWNLAFEICTGPGVVGSDWHRSLCGYS
jgi:hypothetical protein